VTRYAAIGDDGMRPVVWGVGSSPEEALADARVWLDARNARDELTVIEMTDEQSDAILAGVVGMDELAGVR
jgi:hypothetical protein